jgi:methionyl-tRNA synthetase
MNTLPELFQNPVLFLAFVAWSVVWKGIALWKAARANQRNWFIALLVVNTVGVLEIIYIFLINKKEEQIS